MIKGGYKIIDFKGAELSSTAVEVSGIFKQITDKYNKVILVSGVSIDGELKDDAFALLDVNDDGDTITMTLTVYGGAITVTEDDEVTFAASKTPAELTVEIGDLDDLDTTDKDSVVDAINEVNDVASKAIIKTYTDSLSNDVNDAVNGWAYYTSNATNLPPTASAYFILTLVQVPFKCQLAISRITGELYVRTLSTEWTNWKLATNV